MRSRTAILLSLILIVVGATIAWAANSTRRLSFDALLGTSNELKGGTLEKGFDTQSVKPYASQGKITGKIQNKTGQKMTNVVISITASAPSGSVPPHISGGSVGNASIPDGGSGNSSRVDLGNGVDDGSSLDVTIDVSAPDLSGNPPKTEATNFKVEITPSSNRASVSEYDIVEAYNLSTTRTQIEHGVGVHGHDAIGMFVNNVDGSQRITQFTGTMTFPSGSGLSVSQVLLYDSPDGSAVSGATITIDSSTAFTVTGVSLGQNASKYLIVRFSGTPASETNLLLHASFRE